MLVSHHLVARILTPSLYRRAVLLPPLYSGEGWGGGFSLTQFAARRVERGPGGEVLTYKGRFFHKVRISRENSMFISLPFEPASAGFIPLAGWL